MPIKDPVKAKENARKNYIKNRVERIAKSKICVEANIEKVKASRKEYYERNKETIKKLHLSCTVRYANYKKSARNKNLELKLTFEQFSVITGEKCIYCGEFFPGKSYSGIDRVNNDIGYI